MHPGQKIAAKSRSQARSNDSMDATPSIPWPRVSELDDETPPASSHKQNYTKDDLPFPPGGNHRHIWGKSFRPALLSWAGSQDNPFGTNGTIHSEISDIWCRLYPDI